VVNATEKFSPEHPEWLQKVAEPAKRLALDTLNELTHGWGRALAVAYAVFWFAALSLFTLNLAGDAVGATDVLQMIAAAILASAPLAMSVDPASVSASCDDLLTELNAQRCELLDNEEGVAMIRRLEEYLNTLNNRQGLGFSSNGLVLDKQRLRTMMIAVFGIFSTVVPFIFALFTGAPIDAMLVYGQMDNSTKTYAYSAEPMSYNRAASQCESLWMTPVSVHSAAENNALAQLQGYRQDVKVWLGATRLPGKDDSHTDYRDDWSWEDGSAWDFDPVQMCTELCDHFEVGSSTHAGVIHRVGGNGAMKWADEARSEQFGIFCQAKSLSSIRGSIPKVVMRLGGPRSKVVLEELLSLGGNK
jgi:hypothetical protein